MDAESQLIKQRIDKLNEIKKLGFNPYPYKFSQKNHSSEILEKFKKAEHEPSKEQVSLAGRIMTLRLMGKASFVHVQDETGKIQVYVRQDEIGEKNYELFRKLDMGDIIGVEGSVFKTKAGEISVWAKEIELLCKSIRSLPEKWHGLKDTEIRYRKRYLDLISNPEVKETFVKKSKLINFIREFLNKKGFLEVETPIIQPIYGGAAAKPFKSHFNDLKMDVFLRISDELYLKRLIVGGFEKVYEISKVFRNESVDSTHNPEFTMLEFYQAYADYDEMMKFVEDMIINACKEVNGTNKIKFRGHTVEIKKPFKVMTMKDSVKKIAGIDTDKLNDKELKKEMDKYNVKHIEFSRGNALQLLFEELVQDKLIQPTFITDHPIESTPLCKPTKYDNTLIERFELFVCGFELGNAYSELNDPLLQRKLLEDQSKQLSRGNEEANPMDEDFIESIETGMPPTGGVGIGIDRLSMVLLGKDSIKDVILFPFMKSFKNS